MLRGNPARCGCKPAQVARQPLPALCAHSMLIGAFGFW
jgi:hypothetical protein